MSEHARAAARPSFLALADRFDPRRVIQAGMMFFIVASLGWGLLAFTMRSARRAAAR
ncbi:MAG: hypothetical protein HY322_04725 [Betaproteobacteria bacterium]|nr:hypothetical protein [Betaproteobacteria bacterium]